MANLHQVKPGIEKITLPDFYHANQPTEIKLKRDLTPQKNAETYYRKSKNQQIEIDRLRKNLKDKTKDKEQAERQLSSLQQVSSLKELRALFQQQALPEKKEINTPLPYHEFAFNGYTILVGRNAQANDVLTLKHTYKEDLWLHAKDVAGSHVVIKHKAGKPFPKDVIERAAQLAAYNSKRKTESLVPVSYTPKKYVRKRKGDPAGMVVVEREDVILVEPKLIDNVK
jgi:predicted ribosome quality control (RQC) complex YloA/Tae2 family protein